MEKTSLWHAVFCEHEGSSLPKKNVKIKICDYQIHLLLSWAVYDIKRKIARVHNTVFCEC